MPDVNYGYRHIDNILDDEKIKNIIDPFFEENNLEKVFKVLLIDVYKNNKILFGTRDKYKKLCF